MPRSLSKRRGFHKGNREAATAAGWASKSKKCRSKVLESPQVGLGRRDVGKSADGCSTHRVPLIGSVQLLPRPPCRCSFSCPVDPPSPQAHLLFFPQIWCSITIKTAIRVRTYSVVVYYSRLFRLKCLGSVSNPDRSKWWQTTLLSPARSGTTRSLSIQHRMVVLFRTLSLRKEVHWSILPT